MTQVIKVSVQPDHIERIASTRTPLGAIQELIWNALDADATSVRVTLDRNLLGGIQQIEIRDNGSGLPFSESKDAFRKLGGSSKRSDETTPSGRVIHGRLGRGRFKALGLGGEVRWITRYSSNGTTYEYEVLILARRPSEFRLEDQTPTDHAPGTTVIVSDITDELAQLQREDAVQKLAETFALYLKQYPDIDVVYDGTRINPSLVEDSSAEYEFTAHLPDEDRDIHCVLQIIEWKVRADRALYLCDSNGLAYSTIPPGIQAPGFHFTAYLKSDYVKSLHESGDLILEELNLDLNQVLDQAKELLRDHFRLRAAEKAEGLVADWKRDDIYPYEGQPASVIEQAERQVFDVVALNVHSYLPSFEDSDSKSKRFQFRLLKQALESSPSALQTILVDVLGLPEEKQRELAELLEKTSLEAIINASKIVADRLDFLAGLELLVFDPDLKERLLERQQLHKIIADEAWIFGEHYNLSVSDQGLTNVLRAHLKSSELEVLDHSPVRTSTGGSGIIDLMLSKVAFLGGKPELREHLIVELKRPRVKIDLEATTQIKKYAAAIAKDERFRDTNVKWEFWALSNQMDDAVRDDATQQNRETGLLFEKPPMRI